MSANRVTWLSTGGFFQSPEQATLGAEVMATGRTTLLSFIC